MTAPFSPALVAGMVLPPPATPLIARALQAFVTRLWWRHHDSFERLADYAGAIFLIDPVDLPLSFLLEVAPDGPRLTTMGRHDRPGNSRQPTAIIRGSLQALLQMAEGKVDGDALFFNRDLKIAGDTEAVVAFRNAVDDADINLIEELAGTLGPLAKPVADVAGTAAALAGRLIDDFDRLQQAILGPLTKRLAAQKETIAALAIRVAALEQRAKHRNPPHKRKIPR